MGEVKSVFNLDLVSPSSVVNPLAWKSHNQCRKRVARGPTGSLKRRSTVSTKSLYRHGPAVTAQRLLADVNEVQQYLLLRTFARILPNRFEWAPFSIAPFATAMLRHDFRSNKEETENRAAISSTSYLSHLSFPVL